MPSPLLVAQRLTSADLEANRQGRLSATQVQRIRAQLDAARRPPQLSCVGVPIASGVLLYMQSKNVATLLGWLLIAATLCGAVFLLVRGRPRSVYAELTAGKVAHIEGAISRISRWPSRDFFQVTIGGVTLKSYGIETADQLREGQVVRAYYLPGAKTLVAVET